LELGVSHGTINTDLRGQNYPPSQKDANETNGGGGDGGQNYPPAFDGGRAAQLLIAHSAGPTDASTTPAAPAIPSAVRSIKERQIRVEECRRRRQRKRRSPAVRGLKSAGCIEPAAQRQSERIGLYSAEFAEARRLVRELTRQAR
jgi:hypothetical protein